MSYTFSREQGDYWYYDQIPSMLLSGSILEFGAGSGDNQLWSKHGEVFKTLNEEGKYLGLDIVKRRNPRLKIIQRNILDWTPEPIYDTVLAIEIIEHIPFRDWDLMFSIMRNSLKSGGHIFLSTPYNQSLERYVLGYKLQSQGEKNQVHVTFGITDKVIKHFLPNAKVWVAKRWSFREKNESLIWATMRFLKRTITQHPYSKPVSEKLFAIWKKPSI